MLGVTGSKMGGAVVGAAGGDTGGTSWPGVVGSIIEFTTCFHEFFEYESTNFFTNTSQLKKKTNSLLVKKGIFTQF